MITTPFWYNDPTILFSQDSITEIFPSKRFDILRKLKPDKFEDLIAILALYRPGPIGSGMVDDFIKRKNGMLKIAYDHPLLEATLKDTYGIIVYQEQIMKIVNVLAKFSLAQADSLRRAISKKKPEIIEEQKKFSKDYILIVFFHIKNLSFFL